MCRSVLELGSYTDYKPPEAVTEHHLRVEWRASLSHQRSAGSRASDRPHLSRVPTAAGAPERSHHDRTLLPTISVFPEEAPCLQRLYGERPHQALASWSRWMQCGGHLGHTTGSCLECAPALKVDHDHQEITYTRKNQQILWMT